MGNREIEYLKSISYNDITNNDITLRIKEFKAIFDSEFKKNIPLDKYHILFGGEGKTITLQSIERKGKSAFSFGSHVENSEGEKKRTRRSRYLHLHKPKGSNKLEIIR